MKAITEALCGLDISKSQVSRLAKDLDEDIHAWRFRKLDKEYPYLVVDARYEKIRINHQVVSQGVLLAVGIGSDGYREILARGLPTRRMKRAGRRCSRSSRKEALKEYGMWSLTTMPVW